MGLFGKKKEAANAPQVEMSTCDCGNMRKSIGNEAKSASGTASKAVAAVKVLGSGCAKCNQLEAATREAMIHLGMDEAIEHVTDFTQIAAYGVMTTPALVVDGKVVSYGKVLKTEEVITLIKKARG